MKHLKKIIFGLFILSGIALTSLFYSCDGGDEDCLDNISKSEIIKKAAPGTYPSELPC